MKPYLLSAVLTICSETAFGLDVVIDADIKGNDSSKIVISTNLPDNTKGRTVIYNESLDYTEQIETEVSAGYFKAVEPARPGILPPGTYTLEVSLRPAQLQPSTVQSVIGGRGEMLQGSCARKGMMGRTIFYTKEIVVQ